MADDPDDNLDGDPDPIPDDDLPAPTPLQAAIAAGDSDAVAALLDAGADVRYVREHGYDAIIDAVHGRDDARLLDVLAVLIDSGAPLSGITSYNESGLRVLSRLGRFDGVRLLLDAGADANHLGWMPLHRAVALGTVDDVRASLDTRGEIEARDYWSRTPWLLAVRMGDVGKAELLRAAGATADAGRCGIPPLVHAVEAGSAEMVAYLLDLGEPVNGTDDFGRTPLMEAVGYGNAEIVELLLAAGADVNADCNGPVIGRAFSREIVLRLLAAGADPVGLDDERRRLLVGLPADMDESALDGITRDDYDRAAAHGVGLANPHRLDEPYLTAMIRAGVTAYRARVRFDPDGDRFSPAVWCARRFGQSLTLLPDGRAVQIAGEHEDFYDPDFRIYNDVFVHHADGRIDVYGYPEEAFPPTDFHTATLDGGAIWIVGNVGYAWSRRYGTMPVYRLDLGTMRIDAVETTGGPGWISRHRAATVGPGLLRVWGGRVLTTDGECERREDVAGSWVLDLSRGVWYHDPG